MYLTVTEHYKGSFPVDIGGLQLAARGPRKVEPDEYAEKLLRMNFPYVVQCDENGKYLVEVPPLPEPPVLVLAPPTEPVSKSETPAEDAGGQVSPEVADQPVIEPVRPRRRK